MGREQESIGKTKNRVKLRSRKYEAVSWTSPELDTLYNYSKIQFMRQLLLSLGLNKIKNKDDEASWFIFHNNQNIREAIIK